MAVQQILQHYRTMASKIRLPLHCLKALDKLSTCRTAALGGHAQYCENNHLNGIWYNSCKHRACPQCRGMPTEEWLINTREVLLDCPHHHIIFTLPSVLNDLWRYNQSLMTDIRKIRRKIRGRKNRTKRPLNYQGGAEGAVALRVWVWWSTAYLGN